MDIDQLSEDEARRLAVDLVIFPAAFVVCEVIGLVALITESGTAFAVFAVWLLATIMPLTFYLMSRLARVSDRGSAGAFGRDWMLGPWKLSLGKDGRKVHERGRVDRRLWPLQVALHVLALAGIVWVPFAFVASQG